jgi:hypothetical protein
MRDQGSPFYLPVLATEWRAVAESLAEVAKLAASISKIGRCADSPEEVANWAVYVLRYR